VVIDIPAMLDSHNGPNLVGKKDVSGQTDRESDAGR